MFIARIETTNFTTKKKRNPKNFTWSLKNEEFQKESSMILDFYL